MYPNTRHIVGADFIRSFACFWVFLRHLARHTDKWDEQTPLAALLRTGDYGVGMFFVLSGFLLSIPYWKSFLEQRKAPSLQRYLLRRFARIVPAYYLCVLSLVLFYGLYQSNWDRYSLLLMFTFTNSFVSAMYKPEFNDALWSIPVEVHFYLLFALLTLGMHKLRTMRGIYLALASCIVLLFCFQYSLLRIAPQIAALVNEPALFSADTWSTTKNALALFAHFLIGVAATGLHLRLKTHANNSFNRFGLLSLFSLSVLLFGYGMQLFNLPEISLMQYSFPVFPALIACLLIALPRSAGIGAFFETRLNYWFSVLSYGIYLWHIPVLRGLDALFLTEPLHGWLEIFAFGSLALICSSAVAAGSYFVLERPVLRWAKQMS